MREAHHNQYMTHARLRVFAARVERARNNVRRFFDRCERPYVAFSGGKDSTAMLGLLAEMDLTSIPVFTQADDLDWPEKRDFCGRVIAQLGFGDYTYAESRVSALAQLTNLECGDGVIRGTFSHVVTEYVRAREREGVLMGLRSEESSGRRMNRACNGSVYRTKAGEWRCTPIVDWCGVDVFAFICSRGLPYFHIYDHDEMQPSHEIRMSWMLNPSFVDRGAASFLHSHYPTHFARLARLNSALWRYV